MPSRREFIARVGAIGTVSVPLCSSVVTSQPKRRKSAASSGSENVEGHAARENPVPDVRLSMTERLANEIGERKWELYNVTKRYIENAFSGILEPISIRADETPVAVTGETASAVLYAFNHVDSPRGAKYSHLLFTDPPKTRLTEGDADTRTGPGCAIRSVNTNKSVLTDAPRILSVDGADVSDAVLVKTPEAARTTTDANWIGKRQLSVMIHEIGHNVCLQHRDGNVWYGTTAPDCYHPIRDETHIYVSPMLGEYYFGDPEKFVSDGRIPSWTGEQYVYFGTVYPPANAARVRRSLTGRRGVSA